MNPTPQHVGFECHLCQTRMYATFEQVGKLAKCPDCGAVTKVPPPVVVKAKPLPAAMEGEQYELWDADAAPTNSELLAAQPTYIPIHCRLCQTLFYATLDQVGAELPCPDCGTLHLVPPPVAREPAAQARTGKALARAADSGSHELAAAPSARPPTIAPTRRSMLYEEEADRARRRRNRAKVDARGRPIIPRWPLVTGIVPFMFSRGVPIRWFTLSVVAALAAGLAISGAGSIGVGGGFVAVGLHAIRGMFLLVLGSAIGVVWLAAVASTIVTIVTESSDGNDRIYRWPPANVMEWLPEMLQFIVAGFVSPFPGWLLTQLVREAWENAVLVIGGSVVVTLPIVLLSQLEINSPFAVLSGRMLQSLARCPFSWLFFYVLFAGIVIGCGAVTYSAFTANLWTLVPVVPLYVAAILLSARLLGRLGWKLAESMPADS